MSESAVGILKRLQDHRLRLFRTSDVVTLTGMTPYAAAQALRRLAARGLLYSMKRGLWVSRMAGDVEAFEAVPHLIAPWPGYVSLHSALSRHGLIDEVPQAVYAVTSGRAARYSTPLGSFHIHHLPNHLIWGYKIEQSGRASYPIAEPEKAFLDLAYLGLIPRSPLGMPYKRDGRWKLNSTRLLRDARRFQFPPLMAYLRTNKRIKLR